MRQYPDCDSIKPCSDPPVGNGKCAGCHGTGFGALFDTFIKEFLDAEPPSSEECYGTDKCQTCKGTGIIEEPEIKIAA
jgi:DnaJ-class molecular chaperone